MSTTPSTRRKKPVQARSRQMVETLMQATARVLVEDGYENLTTNRIAKTAGVSVGSLYQYFPNKQALVMELARRHNQEMMDSLAEHVATLLTAPIPEAVRTYVHATITHHAREPELTQALTVQQLSLGLDLVADSLQRAKPLVHAWLTAHKAEILPENLELATWMLIHLVEFTIHGALVEDPALLAAPAFEDELVLVVLRYLVGG